VVLRGRGRGRPVRRFHECEVHIHAAWIVFLGWVMAAVGLGLGLRDVYMYPALARELFSSLLQVVLLSVFSCNYSSTLIHGLRSDSVTCGSVS
jgi:hypothetical protein